MSTPLSPATIAHSRHRNRACERRPRRPPWKLVELKAARLPPETPAHSVIVVHTPRALLQTSAVEEERKRMPARPIRMNGLTTRHTSACRLDKTEHRRKDAVDHTPREREASHNDGLSLTAGALRITFGFHKSKRVHTRVRRK